MPLAIDVSPANRHDTKGIVPVLRTLAEGTFQGAALGDLGQRGKWLTEAGETLSITVEAIRSSGYSTGRAGGALASLARGRHGRFVPASICWVVEHSLAWLSRYRRLNNIFERSKKHLIAFVAIAFISSLSGRMRRLVTDEMSA